MAGMAIVVAFEHGKVNDIYAGFQNTCPVWSIWDGKKSDSARKLHEI